MSRPLPTESVLIEGAAGNIDTLIDSPTKPDSPRGIALIGHPHPLFGGSNTNKVVHTLARTLRELGYVCLRPNFRGVGLSAGEHDEGVGETADMLSVLNWAQARWGKLPLTLAGFSFGSYVQSQLANQLADSGQPPQQLILVGTATGETTGSGRNYRTPNLPADLPAVLLHGEVNDTVPIANVLDWARPQERVVCIIPGADFFHGKLHLIRAHLLSTLGPRD